MKNKEKIQEYVWIPEYYFQNNCRWYKIELQGPVTPWYDTLLTTPWSKK